MAEFQKLVQIKKRICAKYRRFDCSGCPIIDRGASDLCGIISISGYEDAAFKELEDGLLAWAAEHPEPVYPTWVEWLVDSGVFPQKMSTIPSVAFNTIKDSLAVEIPADIAQKLGIEPKEGV